MILKVRRQACRWEKMNHVFECNGGVSLDFVRELCHVFILITFEPSRVIEPFGYSLLPSNSGQISVGRLRSPQ